MTTSHKKLSKDSFNISINNLFNILFIYYDMYMVSLTVLQTGISSFKNFINKYMTWCFKCFTVNKRHNLYLYRTVVYRSHCHISPLFVSDFPTLFLPLSLPAWQPAPPLLPPPPPPSQNHPPDWCTNASVARTVLGAPHLVF